MGALGYVMHGSGEPAALNSAARGAGRRMSCEKAKDKYAWKDLNEVLARLPFAAQTSRATGVRTRVD